MRKRARTDLCGGRSAMVVPTATVVHALPVYPSFVGQLLPILVERLASTGHSEVLRPQVLDYPLGQPPIGQGKFRRRRRGLV